MRIPQFSKIVRKHTVRETINGSTLVIDGHNYFYDCYEESGLSNKFGCESDKYFQVLKDNLKKFKMADVKCYFLFKDGYKDTEIKAQKKRDGDINRFVAPIFMLDIHREILEEMGFEYAYCEFEAKPDCMALAQQLKCPVLSNDVEYCFSGVPYINHLHLQFDENTKTLKAEVFRLDRFLVNTGLDKSKLATFLVLTDEYLFPANYFSNFIRTVVLSTDYIQKYETLFRWLKKTDSEVVNSKIFRFISPEDRDKFMEKKHEVMNVIELQRSPGVASRYLLNGCELEVSENDPLWFEKGVAAAITLPYVDLYRRNVFAGLSGALMTSCDDPEPDDPVLLSSDIIRYAYDLLTNFSKAEFVIKSSERCYVQRAPLHVQTGRIAKPEYKAKESVFENGWEDIKDLKLFEHFLIQQFQGFDFDILKRLPEDTKLLMISLCYFKRFSSSGQKESIMRGILFSYVALGVVNQKGNNFKSSVNEKDKEVAKKELEILASTRAGKGDKKMIHSLTEFQHCISNFSSLNKLCGSPYKPILFSQMYDGDLVAKVMQPIVFAHGSIERAVWSFLESRLLGRAPTVLNVMNDLFKICKDFN